MTACVSTALTNVTGMAAGSEAWSKYQNDLWHWFKHARPLLTARISIPAEIPNLRSEEDYLSLAREVCRLAAQGAPETEVRVRETGQPDSQAGGATFGHDYLVWYQPSRGVPGLFVVVIDRGTHGELRTMFPPVEGYSYYLEQGGLPVH